MLSKNFKLKEFTCSATATRLGICNEPPQSVISNLQRLCQEVLQPIRDRYGKSIIVSSGYRSRQLNTAIGGFQNSDHMYGCAADIKASPPTPPPFGRGVNILTSQQRANKELFDLILGMIKNGDLTVKQLIDEKNYSWIHISFQDGRTSKINQVLHLK